ncbi:XRE family transcriptional regulator [Sphingomonas melonis]|uniref:Phage repressor protein C with HTH and peptisase S24 domain n=1 Tax=Sphingomonas melonis TaxID=152682 RepID=A0A7Y9FQV2_9SPHN|nr:S24 family peptidase [Sphingomonas melonis]NYD91417.1 phage repressor protein C with HTH and peptisase S24 domain [Sphingomonas melonis]
MVNPKRMARRYNFWNISSGMSIVPQRLAEVMKARGIGQSDLARRVGVQQGTISKIINGSTSNSRYLLRIARELGTTPAYLEGEIDDPGDDAPQPAARGALAIPDMVELQQIDFAYGMGATYVDGHVDVQLLHFPRVWIEAITTSPPAMLTWASGKGDSMTPTIHDGDLVLLDRSQRQVVEQDALWAYTVGDLGAIKRLRVKGDRVIILSDNPSVPPDEERVEEVNIVARVIFIGRRT